MTDLEMPSEDLRSKERKQQEKMEAYYSFQSKIYDATRWSFLFGRKSLINCIPSLPRRPTILEVGCGTGHNLGIVNRRFPDAQIYGIDASSTMVLKSAKKIQSKPRIKIFHETYGSPSNQRPKQSDLIIFSYALSMINPQWKNLIEHAYEDLNDGGTIAVLDFDFSKFSWFKHHMANNHVRMDAHLRPKLLKHFSPIVDKSQSAYFGLWNYFTFIGQK